MRRHAEESRPNVSEGRRMSAIDTIHTTRRFLHERDGRAPALECCAALP